jgi:hypothetical protein
MTARSAGLSGVEPWPDLRLPGWQGTLASLHMWTQIVGKVRMALAPMINQWWQVPLYVSARGLTTSLMHADRRGIEIEFDFIDHVLDLRTSDGDRRQVTLEPVTVADFFAATMGALAELDVGVSIFARPVEVADATPFADDNRPRIYEPAAASALWHSLLGAERLMTLFRAGFVGKVSPVHFFWGGADLAVTRFSGRRAPKHPGGVPNCPDWVQELAYSHEVSSCGFWPEGGEEGMFYAYAYPEPAGFSESRIEPAAGYYDTSLGEFLLPYAAVRTAEDPDATLMAFLQSTYEATADLGAWPRRELEAG